MRAALVALLVALFSGAAFADTKQECIAASSSAQDLRRENKLVEARKELLVCAREACPKVIQRDCAEWLGQVDVSIPTIVVSVRDAAGVDVVAARVQLDGVPFQDTVDGKARPVNPGIHKLRTDVTTVPVEQEFVIREGEKNRLVELRLPAPPTTTPPPTEPPPTGTTGTISTSPGPTETPIKQPPATGPTKPDPPTPTPTPAPAPAPQKSVFRQNLVPLLVGGSAVPLLVGALGFELWGRSTYDGAKAEMSDQGKRDDLYDSANVKRYVAQGLGIAAIGCVGVAIFLYVRSRGNDDADTVTTTHVAPVAGHDQAGLVLTGSF